MNRTNYFGWLFLAVWAVWLCAFSGYLVQFAGLGHWAPQFQTALFVALAARIPVSDIPKLALTMGLARVAVSIDTPAAVLASALSIGLVLRLARSAIQVESPVIAATLAFLACTLESAWLEAVHLRTQAALASDWNSVQLAWPAGITTAIATAAFGGVLANLPGLGNLIRRKTWAVGASLR